ncbi:MAG: recombinase family protein, partial [Raoultibacter sp.]
MPNAAIYARYSSHNQREESIEDQLRECREYAVKCGYSVVAEYCDHAISGTTDMRPEFQRMIEDSRGHSFDVVIVYKIDRFARNRYDSAMYKARLKKNDVKVVYAKEGIPEGPEGILLESLLEGMAEYYSANLAQNIKRGMTGNAMKGKANGVTVYGFDIGEDGYYKVNETEWAVVETIYQLAAEGTTLYDICTAVSPAKTKRGKDFTPAMVSKMLRNPKYAGCYIYDEVTIEGAMPRSIDPVLRSRVEARLSMSRKKPGKGGRANYILTGKLFCANCNAPMSGYSGRSASGAKKYTYYKCIGECRSAIPQDKIEQLVANTVREALSNAETRATIADAVFDAQDGFDSQEADYRAAIEKRIKQVDNENNRIVEAICSGVLVDGL